MTTSTTRPATAGPDLTTERTTRHRRLGAIVLLGLLVLGLAGTFGWTRLHGTTNLVASASVGRGNAGSGYAAGGSVYNQQVPTAGRSVNAFRPGSAYATTWSVFVEQVPAPALIHPFGPGSSYASTWSVFTEQVPAAAPPASA